jgi:hypothetical protein
MGWGMGGGDEGWGMGGYVDFIILPVDASRMLSILGSAIALDRLDWFV